MWNDCSSLVHSKKPEAKYVGGDARVPVYSDGNAYVAVAFEGRFQVVVKKIRNWIERKGCCCFRSIEAVVRPWKTL